MARAMSSLPVPDSPVMRTVDVVLPMRETRSKRARIFREIADDRRRSAPRPAP